MHLYALWDTRKLLTGVHPLNEYKRRALSVIIGAAELCGSDVLQKYFHYICFSYVVKLNLKGLRNSFC